VLIALDGNLDIPTPYTIIDAMLVNQNQPVYVYAYYLLELCFIHEKMATFEFK
jgi:hypothetical protein